MNRTHVQLRTDEPPNQVHGRLLESVHLAGYSFGRACHELKWLLRQDRWKQVGPGYDDINKFLATMDFSELRAAREERKDIVRQLAIIQAGQRATARLLGVGEQTVARDLGKSRGVAPKGAAALPVNARSHNDNNDQSLEMSAPKGALPNPYYDEAGITIYHGDCRDILPGVERGLMVTDPPYNVGYHYDEYHDAMDEDAYWAFLKDVLRMPLVVIHYPEKLFPVTSHFHQAPDKVVAWIYGANTPKQWRAIAWFGLAPDFSLASQDYRNLTDKRVQKLIEQGRKARLYDWWPIDIVKNSSAEKTEHPCQIPEEVMKLALQITPFDGPVIDPFCGSGTTLLAAQELGRRAIGIESSEEYCQIAKDRLRQTVLGLAG